MNTESTNRQVLIEKRQAAIDHRVAELLAKIEATNQKFDTCIKIMIKHLLDEKNFRNN